MYSLGYVVVGDDGGGKLDSADVSSALQRCLRNFPSLGEYKTGHGRKQLLQDIRSHLPPFETE